MKNITITLFLIKFLFLCSCIVPESTHIAPKFYLLSHNNVDQNESDSKILNFNDLNISKSINAFYIKQVELPSYLDQNRIVYRLKADEIQFCENDRWGEPLEEGFGRVLGSSLSRSLKSPFFSVFPHRKKNGSYFELVVSLDRFEKISNSEVLLSGGWEVYTQDFKNGTHPIINGNEVIRAKINNEKASTNNLNDEIFALSESINIFAIRVANAYKDLQISLSSD